MNFLNSVNFLAGSACVVTCFTLFANSTSYAAPANGPVNTAVSDQRGYQAQIVDDAIRPLLQQYNIAGMAVAISRDGKNYFYNYGVASKATQQAVTAETLFEIGSISKTFTATLASYAQVSGQLNFSEPVSKYLPILRGSSFDHISVLHLGTHTAGYFPLQIPDDIQTDAQLMEYYRHWHPDHPAGTHRTYTNPGAGLLAIVAAASMNMSITDALEKILFPQLGMSHSYIEVPPTQMHNYAQGYNDADEPVRVNPGVLAAQAYGVKTNSADLIRFINANLGSGVSRRTDQTLPQPALDEKLQRAINNTHVGYFKTPKSVGAMTQDLMWEQYPDSVALVQIIAGNSGAMLDQMPVTKLTPPLAPQNNVILNKTGSTGGFGAYVLIRPARKFGIAILANKSYPNEAKVNAAFQIMKQLEAQHEN